VTVLGWQLSLGPQGKIGKATAEALKSQGITTVGIALTCEDSDEIRQCNILDEETVEQVFHDLV
jgi:hypothetical protein